MKFYFSGIADKATFAMLEAAKVAHLLVDQTDARNVPAERRIGILDSGAFRAFKAGTRLAMASYITNAEKLAERSDLIVAPDVVGEPDETMINWNSIRKNRQLRKKLVPVWQWGASLAHLNIYLAHAPIVGIGGLAKIFHDDKTPEEKRRREETLDALVHLCQNIPGRFHIFGLNYLKGIEQLAPFAYSCDSSVWLRGARYGFVIFRHTRNSHLTQAPYRSIPEFANLDRQQRCIASAANIENFLTAVRP